MASLLIFSVTPVVWFFIIGNKFGVKRKIVLIFPVITVIIALINIMWDSVLLRAGFSLLLLILGIILAKKYDLFIRKDVQLLDNINMPIAVKRNLSKAILKFSRAER